jgi:hypothetical protein
MLKYPKIKSYRRLAGIVREGKTPFLEWEKSISN